MGATGFSIHLQPLQGADQADLGQLQREIWELLADYVWYFTSHCTSVWQGYLLEASDADDRWFHAGADQISFWFPDFAGCCARSARASEHWFQAAFAAAYDQVNSLTQDRGWLIASGSPDLAEEVWKTDIRHAWIWVEDDLYEFSLDSNGEAGGLRGDDEFVELSELSSEAREAVSEAVDRGLCPCPVCERLRPDPEFEQAMVESLADERSEVVQTAAWHLRQMARVSTETALIVAGQQADVPRDHAGLCYDFGQKIPVADVERVLDRLQEVDDIGLRCGLLGLAAGVPLEEGTSFERRLFVFVCALREGGVVAEVAAEYGGYGAVAHGHEDHFARALVENMGASHEYDHNVALTLFNFYMRSDRVPRFALEAIRALTTHESAQVQTIASFAHSQLSSRPTRD
jgi:hypothetical protein